MSKPLNRRQFLEGAAGGAALLSLAGPAAAQVPTGAASFNIPTLVDGQRFDPTLVVDAARALAQRPLIPLATNDLPEGYTALPADQYAGIRMQPGATVWAGENRGFTVEPLHRGYVFSNPVSLFTIEDGTVRRIGFDRSKFDYGRVTPPPTNALMPAAASNAGQPTVATAPVAIPTPSVVRPVPMPDAVAVMRGSLAAKPHLPTLADTMPPTAAFTRPL